jgi:predicted DNA-binding transcriptional regulator AlpA
LYNVYRLYTKRKRKFEMSEEKEEMLSTADVRKELGISHQTLYNWIARDILHPVKKNPFLEKSPMLFARSEIDKVKSENAAKKKS